MANKKLGKAKQKVEELIEKNKMAKVKHPLIKSKNSPLVFSERKNVKNGFTHNVRVKRLRPKKK